MQIMFETFNGHRNGSGDSGRFVSVCFKTHNGHRNGFLRRCVEHSSNLRGVSKPLTLFVETYGTEMESLTANGTTHVLKIELVCRRVRGTSYHVDSTRCRCYPARGHESECIRSDVAHDGTLFRETLQQNKTLHVIKMDLVKKCLEMSAETAEKNDYIESYEQSGKCLKLENHDDSTIRAQIAELLELNTFKSEDEQFSLKEYADRMK